MISRHPLSVLSGLLVWIGPLLPAAICQDEPTLSDRLAAAVSWWDRPDAPGIAVAVRRGDEVLLRKGLGRASLEYEAPITPETIFHVASVSKQFTAFAVSLLADEGRLSWEDDVRKHLPVVPDLGAPISLRQLANHTSGLRDQWELLVLAGWRMDDVITLGHVLDLVARQRELNFPPGSQELYCNTGYTLLAQVVEAVSHRSFPDFCEEKIFQPLGMKRSHFHDDHTHIVAGRAYSYAPSPTGFRNSVLSYSIAGATSLFTTVDDLLRWNENFETHRVGSPRVVDWMLERATLTNGETLDTAKGLFHGTHHGRSTISHSGGDAGFRSYLLRFPREQIDIVVLSNRADCPTRGIALRLADIVLGEDAPPPLRQETEVGAPDVERVGPTPRTLQRLPGLYLDAESGICWKLQRAAGGLQLLSESQAHRLAAAGAERFVTTSPGVHFELAFSLGSNGPEKLRLIEPGRGERPLMSVSPPQPSRERLGELAGKYHSDELDITYEIELRDADLYLRRPKYGLEPLQPRFEDGFTTGWMRLRFLRDQDGQPAQLLVSTGRVWNLRFTRED